MVQRAKNNEFVESGLETKLLMSEVDNSHNRLVVTGKHKQRVWTRKVFLGQVRKRLFLYIYIYIYIYIFLLDLYKITVLEHTVIFLQII